MKGNNKYLLRGKIVKMTSENDVIEDGYIHVENGLIQAIYSDKAEIPKDIQQLSIIDSGGTIYPGLIDLHNHFVYNVLPLWVVPKKYKNRSEWPRHKEYIAGVSKPIKDVLAKYSVTAKAVVRYVETKALLGGTTTGQGMRTRVNGGSKLFVGAMRNVEEPESEKLLPAGTRVPDLYTQGKTGPERIESFKRALSKKDRSAYFYHLSEGVDEKSRQHFFNLKENDLINHKLVGIHALGLEQEDLEYMAERGAKIVWSPFSNMLLYGKTLDLNAVKASGIKFCLGCDWSPSGSKNLLEELKIADFVNKKSNQPYSDYELVCMVTKSAAEVVDWDEYLGVIEAGKMADLLVIQNNVVYSGLINATESDIKLLIINGTARYGDTHLMEQYYSEQTSDLEKIEVGTKLKYLNTYAENSEINDLTFTEAKATLTKVTRDLNAFKEEMETKQREAITRGGVSSPSSFQLDFEEGLHMHEDDIFDEMEEEIVWRGRADIKMVDSLLLDGAFVDNEETDYWDRIAQQGNIGKELKDWLRGFYLNGV